MDRFNAIATYNDVRQWSSEIDGFRLAYEIEGDGPAIALLHGWPGDRSDWYEIAQRLKMRFKERPDPRKFGASGKLQGVEPQSVLE